MLTMSMLLLAFLSFAVLLAIWLGAPNETPD